MTPDEWAALVLLCVGGLLVLVAVVSAVVTRNQKGPR